MNASKQQGFTIIELVVVILLLGILTATALPRFMDVTEEAHDAAVDGVVGGLSTSMALFHAQWVANGQPIAATVVTDFGTVAGVAVTNAEGYPAGNTGDDGTVDSGAECLNIFDNVLQSGHPTISTVADAAALAGADWSAAGTDYVTNFTTGNGLCNFVYILEDNDGTVAPANTAVITFDPTVGEVLRIADI